LFFGVTLLYKGLLKGMRSDSPQFTKPMNDAFKMSANHYGEVLLQRSLMTQRWEKFFEEYDFLICPVAYGPAYKRCKTGSKLSYDGKEMIYVNKIPDDKITKVSTTITFSCYLNRWTFHTPV